MTISLRLTIQALHGRVAAHYGAPHVNLVPLFAALPPPLRRLAFRDDCHHTEAGAALAAAAVCLCVRRMCTGAFAFGGNRGDGGGSGGGGRGSGGGSGDGGAGGASGGGALDLDQQQRAIRRPLPPPLHSAVWPCGRAQPVRPEELSWMYAPMLKTRSQAKAWQRAHLTVGTMVGRG